MCTMITTIEQERRKHEEIQRRMVAVAQRMLARKQELQPEIREAINELKKRNAKRMK